MRLQTIKDGRSAAIGCVNILTVLLIVLLIAPLVFADDANPAAPAALEQPFARVGDVLITRGEYEQAFALAMRTRYYHGAPPEGERETIRESVANDLITRAALLQEAARLGLNPDYAEIQAKLDKYAARYGDSERWKSAGAEMLEAVKRRLAEDDLLLQLETQARDVEPETDDDPRAYYDANLDKFTEPAQHRISLILLAVDPSSPPAVRDAATEEAARLVQKLDEGADFAELAKLHSGHASASAGGDMGYLHLGMLNAQAEAALAELKVGQVSAPIRILEGVAVMRLEHRKPERIRDYDEVLERVRDLWRRDRSEEAWEQYRSRIREQTSVERFGEQEPASAVRTGPRPNRLS
jgi:parvulin-like peptidyl-prolyl isomerase